MDPVESLVQLVEPWSRIYNDSAVLQTAVLYAHLGGVLLGGGLAIAADRATLRVARSSRDVRLYQLNELADVHRPVLAGLTLAFISGLLLLAADLRTFAESPVFWGKMVVILVLLANGFGLQRAEARLRRAMNTDAGAWRGLRRGAVTSMALWFVALLVGAILPTLS